MANLAIAKKIVQELVSLGVREFCLGAGSRNSPLVAAIASSPDVKSYFFFDERSAAFFALGRIQASGHPVAVVTTSGTAAAELLPAMIEGHYAGLPLIAVTADRPLRYRGTGAPQAIEQKHLFGPYAEVFWEGPNVESAKNSDQLLSFSSEFSSWTQLRPIHLNIFFDEPLLDAEVELPRYLMPVPEAPELLLDLDLVTKVSETLSAFLAAAQRPVVLLSGIPVRARGFVEEFCLRLGAPIYAEAQSGLRDSTRLKQLLVCSGERQIYSGKFDAILRFGSVPTCRLWRDLETTLSQLKVLSLDHRPFSGSPRVAHQQIELSSWLLERVVMPRNKFSGGFFSEFFQEDQRRNEQKLSLFSQYPRSEPALIHHLSRRIPKRAQVFLGNSLAIREWDLAADRGQRGYEFFANRGANGIDGEVSTFMGTCADDRDNVAILGDLTALYDLSAPWIVDQLGDPAFQIVVINNGGGRIFGRLPVLRHINEHVRREALELEHQTRLQGWAHMWNLGYELAEDGLPPQWPAARQGILEIVPDNNASTHFWNDFAKIWEKS